MYIFAHHIIAVALIWPLINEWFSCYLQARSVGSEDLVQFSEAFSGRDVYKRQRLDTVAERLQKSISAVINFVFVCSLVVQTYEP